MLSEKQAVLEELASAVYKLEECKEFVYLMPEVRVNVGYASANAKTPMDVAAVDGRVTVVNGYPKAAGSVTFGASDHIARMILGIRKYDESIRAAMNFKCDPQIIKFVEGYCENNKIFLGRIDRKEEPYEIKQIEGKSTSWMIDNLIERYGKIPEIFYDLGGWGKEPLFYVVGENPIKVVEISIDIAKSYFKKIQQNF